MGTTLLLLTEGERHERLRLIDAAVALTETKLYLWFQGDRLPGVATVNLLQDIAEAFQPVGTKDPRLDVVPLLPFASWSEDHVASIPDLVSVLEVSQAGNKASSLTDSLNKQRAQHLPRLRTLELPGPPDRGHDPAAGAGARGSRESGQDGPAAAVEVGCEGTPQEGGLAFEEVAVGGTFDRLHVGHRLLLAATALVCTRRVFMGVTGDQLLAKKSHPELLHPYDQRAASAAAYLTSVRPGLIVQTGALLDPKAPTGAATEAGMQALVVSKETIPGSEAINQYRREHGFKPLVIVVVDLVGESEAVPAGKISSTALREQEAQQLQQGQRQRTVHS